MTKPFSIPRRFRLLTGALAALLLVTSAHQSFVGSHDPGAATQGEHSWQAEARTVRSPEVRAAYEATWRVEQQVAAAPAPPAVPFDPPVPGVPMVALTFDDGPWPGQTEQILAILAERRVPATFFMLGRQVERAPGLAQAVVGAGHVAGNHSYSHRRLDTAPPDVVEWEIVHTTHRIEEVTGTHPYWFRPPGGNIGPSVYASAERAISRPVLWTIDPQDWRETATPEGIAWSVISAAHPNAVILLHDGGGDQWKTIAALPAIIDELRAAGYQFVALDQLPAVKSGW